MANSKKIGGDKLLLGLISAFRLLVLELAEKGLIDAEEYAQKLEELAGTHRQEGDPNGLSDAIHALSEHIQTSIINDR